MTRLEQRLTQSVERLRRLRNQLASEERKRDELIREALRTGYTQRRIAALVKMSAGRIGQIAKTNDKE